MDLLELTKMLASISDRVLLIAVGLLAIRYLTKQNEIHQIELKELAIKSNVLTNQVTEVVATNTAVLERVEKKF